MRWQWLWLFTIPLVVGSVFMPWGEKHIDDHRCRTTWDPDTYESSQRCGSDEWLVEYRPFSMPTVHTKHSFVGSNAIGEAWAYHYSDPEAPHQEGIGPLLEYGGMILAFGAAAMAVTNLGHHIAQFPLTLLVARIGWGLYAAAVVSFSLGIAYHAGTWRAEDVDNLEPRLGLLLGLMPLLAGIPLLPKRDPNQGLPSLPTIQ